MTRFRVTLAAAAATCISVAIGVLAQQAVFRGTADAVRVFITVTDKEGRLVTTLTPSDFEVRDEGKAQPITVFDNTPQPVRLIVMLDVSGSMGGNLPLLRAASHELFRRLRPDDGAKVGTFGDTVTISPSFTHNAQELEAALPRSIAPDAPTPLWRAVDEAMDALGPTGEQRTVILVLSDGKDTEPPSFRRKPISQPRSSTARGEMM
ncbi:MAG: VWA domain-containing protein [Acidobacteriota bacterium]